jgi:hypothetical protein
MRASLTRTKKSPEKKRPCWESMSELRELVLDLWAAGKNRAEIAGMVRCDSLAVTSFVARARCVGDRRAKRRRNRGRQGHRAAMKTATNRTYKAFTRQRCARRFPCTLDELVRIARETSVPVTVVPLGVSGLD